MSVGEGDERHLILDRCPETSVYVKKTQLLLISFQGKDSIILYIQWIIALSLCAATLVPWCLFLFFKTWHLLLYPQCRNWLCVILLWLHLFTRLTEEANAFVSLNSCFYVCMRLLSSFCLLINFSSLSWPYTMLNEFPVKFGIASLI